MFSYGPEWVYALVAGGTGEYSAVGYMHAGCRLAPVVCGHINYGSVGTCMPALSSYQHCIVCHQVVQCMYTQKGGKFVCVEYK